MRAECFDQSPPFSLADFLRIFLNAERRANAGLHGQFHDIAAQIRASVVKLGVEKASASLSLKSARALSCSRVAMERSLT